MRRMSIVVMRYEYCGYENLMELHIFSNPEEGKVILGMPPACMYVCVCVCVYVCMCVCVCKYVCT
jgi:hypothetical protein